MIEHLIAGYVYELQIDNIIPIDYWNIFKYVPYLTMGFYITSLISF